MEEIKKNPRGTAGMTLEVRVEVARKGGIATSRNKAHMSRIGKIGGTKVSQDKAHMSRIGRIGGSKPYRKIEGEDEV